MPTNSDNRPAEEQIASEDTKASVVRLKRQGRTFQEIGDELGFSKQRAHAIYWKTIEDVPAREVKVYRAEQLDVLNYVAQQVAQIMQKDHIAVSNGRVVRIGEPYVDPETGKARIAEGAGEIVLDDMPKIAAAKELRMLSERVAKLLGLDTPVKQEIGVDSTVKYVVEGVNPEAMK